MDEIVPDIDAEFDFAAKNDKHKFISNELIVREMVQSRDSDLTPRLQEILRIMVHSQRVRKWANPMFDFHEELEVNAFRYVCRSITSLMATGQHQNQIQRNSPTNVHSYITSLINQNFHKTIDDTNTRKENEQRRRAKLGTIY